MRGCNVPLCNVVYFRLHGIPFVSAASAAEFSEPWWLKPLRLEIASYLLKPGMAATILPPQERFPTFS